MTPQIGTTVFYTAPSESGIKPGPYPAQVIRAHDDGTLDLVVFGAGRPSAGLFHVEPSQWSTDPNPYKPPAKVKAVAPPGVAAKKPVKAGPRK